MRLIATLFGSPDPWRLALARLHAASEQPAGARHLYDLMEAYTWNNALYEWLQRNQYEEGIKREALKGIRTPAKRIAAFYHSHLWPGDLDTAFPLEFPDDLEEAQQQLIEDAIRQVWEWSNWPTEKDVCALWLAMHGDLFLRVAQPPERDAVYIERVRPQYVTDVHCERGYVKEIRLDVPLDDYEAWPPPSRVGSADRDTWHTEYWSKEAGLYYRWRHKQGPDVALADLGNPAEVLPLAAFGVDFVPFVQAKFEDTGQARGSSCFVDGLDKFDELNRKATRHSQLMFNHNHPDWRLQRAGADATGRPVPAPKIDPDDSGSITIGDERLFRVPAGWDLDQMVANLDYKAYLDVIESEEAAIAADYPEMLWSRLSGATELSGRALEKLLAPAITRCLRARTNADRALQRAHMMALSVGAASGLFPFQAGAYDAGLLRHTFRERPVLPKDGLDDAQALLAEAQAAAERKELGVSQSQVLKELGYTDEQIQEMQRENEQMAQREMERMATMAPQGQPGQNGQPQRNGRPANAR